MPQRDSFSTLCMHSREPKIPSQDFQLLNMGKNNRGTSDRTAGREAALHVANPDSIPASHMIFLSLSGVTPERKARSNT